MDKTRRLFLAVDISDAARGAAENYTRGLRAEFPGLRVGWERPEKLHLTVKFLGDSDEGQTAAILDAARSVASDFEPFSLQISGTGVFPDAARPRILWLGITGEVSVLSDLNARFEAVGETIGFPRETRRFTSHLTVGRVREPFKSSALAGRHLAKKFGPADFVVSAITVYESRLDPNGSSYSVLDRFEFGTKTRAI